MKSSIVILLFIENWDVVENMNKTHTNVMICWSFWDMVDWKQSEDNIFNVLPPQLHWILSVSAYFEFDANNVFQKNWDRDNKRLRKLCYALKTPV